ncbi:hypothetical protein PIB30_104339, partial [Stylosanthes scabra]|nr:hypothetical protein [Stylosanthes scabra]
MMSVDETLMCSFQILKPADRKAKLNFGSSTTTTKPGNSPAGVKFFSPWLAVLPGCKSMKLILKKIAASGGLLYNEHLIVARKG